MGHQPQPVAPQAGYGKAMSAILYESALKLCSEPYTLLKATAVFGLSRDAISSDKRSLAATMALAARDNASWPACDQACFLISCDSPFLDPALSSLIERALDFEFIKGIPARSLCQPITLLPSCAEACLDCEGLAGARFAAMLQSPPPRALLARILRQTPTPELAASRLAKSLDWNWADGRLLTLLQKNSAWCDNSISSIAKAQAERRALARGIKAPARRVGPTL